MSVLAKVSTTLLDIDVAVRFVQDERYGAVSLFIGNVRNCHEGKTVCGITYDIHETIAEQTFHKICLEAQEIWDDTRYAVFHYKGDLKVGGTSIIIAVGSVHRDYSLQACRYVIEEIKKRAPVWKKEHYLEGESEWLPGHSLVKLEKNKKDFSYKRKEKYAEF